MATILTGECDHHITADIAYVGMAVLTRERRQRLHDVQQTPYGPSAARTKIVLGTAQHGLAKVSARICSGAIETIQQQDSLPWLCLGYNRTAAKALSLTVPTALLVRADEVIE